jgi:hypothetical protein
MDDDTRQFKESNSQEFSDDAIRRFLFGRLSAAEQATFEEYLFTGESLEARVRLSEFDLADDYALERLSVPDRKAFEKKFLLSAERKRQVKVSTALRDRFASASTVATPAPKVAKASISQRIQLLFSPNHRSWRFAFAAAALAILVAAAWLVLKESHLRPAIPPPIVRSSPSPGAKREMGHPPGTTSPPEHHTTPSPMPPHGTALPVIVSIDLFPGGDKLPQINLPKGEHDIVRLQLALKPNQTGTFRAELLTINDQSVFIAQSLLSAGRDSGKIAFNVPAAQLKTRDYRVSLSRADDGSKRSVASYYFRVR